MPTHVGSTGVRWVLDPIDGTVNYLYGLPEWAVSVAAEIDGVTVVGVVVELPALGETYVATLGRGARLHDRHGAHDLRVNDPVALDQALIATGFGYRVERRVAQARVVRAGGAAGARHPSRRRVQRRPLLGRGRPGRRLLRARPDGLGPRRRRAGGAEAGARLEGLRGAAGRARTSSSRPVRRSSAALHDLLARLDADDSYN